MTHSMIRRFKIDGILSAEADMIKERNRYEAILDEQMRAEGYVPIFDVRPTWQTEWSGRTFAFWLTMHGVFVGEDKAWTIEGISEGKELPKPTAPAKSKGS